MGVKLKTARDRIQAPERIEDVVAKLIVASQKAALSRDIAELIWRTLIETSIRLEFEVVNSLDRHRTEPRRVARARINQLRSHEKASSESERNGRRMRQYRGEYLSL